VRAMSMRIDCHQHFWNYDPRSYSWITDQMAVLQRAYTPSDLLPELVAARIEATVAVQARQSESENLFLLDLAARYPQIAGIVGWVDLSAPKLPERLASFARFAKVRGFRHVVQDEPDDNFVLRQSILRGIRSLKEYGFTYDILVYPRQLPAAIKLVEALPDQPFVVDHLAKPRVRTKEIESWSRHIRTLAGNQKVYCKISGLITEADWSHWEVEDFYPYLDVVFEAFGPDRLMFGSDWPVCLLAGTYQQVIGIVDDYTRNLKPAEKENIFGNNAARFYRLTCS
jgi:L-fuconolactonase